MMYALVVFEMYSRDSTSTRYGVEIMSYYSTPVNFLSTVPSVRSVEAAANFSMANFWTTRFTSGGLWMSELLSPTELIISSNSETVSTTLNSSLVAISLVTSWKISQSGSMRSTLSTKFSRKLSFPSFSYRKRLGSGLELLNPCSMRHFWCFSFQARAV